MHTEQYDGDDDEIAYFTVRWKTRASFVYRTKNIDNNDKDRFRTTVCSGCTFKWNSCHAATNCDNDLLI